MKQEKQLILAMALAFGGPATGQILPDAPELIGLLESTQSTASLSLGSASLRLPTIGGTVMIEPSSVLATLVLAPPVAGTASATMPVPNQPSLIGLDLYAQAVHFDPGVAFEPFRLTNGLIVSIT